MSIDDPTPEQILEFEQAQIDRMQAEETEKAIKVTDEAIRARYSDTLPEDAFDQREHAKTLNALRVTSRFITLIEDKISDQRAKQGADDLSETQQRLEIIFEAMTLLLPALGIYRQGAATVPPFSTIIADVEVSGETARSGLIVSGTLHPDTLRALLDNNKVAPEDDLNVTK